MTVTEDITRGSAGHGEGGIGRVARVIGPVVDVEFAPDEMPEVYNALHVDRTLEAAADAMPAVADAVRRGDVGPRGGLR